MGGGTHHAPLAALALLACCAPQEAPPSASAPPAAAPARAADEAVEARPAGEDAAGVRDEAQVAVDVHPSWITARDLLARVSAGDPVVALDVRDAGVFQAGHLAGSLNLPPHELRASAAARTGHAVVYAGGHEGARLLRRVDQLREAGVEVKVLLGGIQAWCRAGGAVEGTCDGADLVSAGDAFAEAREPDRALLVALKTDDPELDARAALAQRLHPGARVIPYATVPELTAAATDLANEPGMRLLTVADADGSSYGELRAALGPAVDAHLYYLEGGLAALEHVVDRQTAMWNRKSIVSQGTRGGAASRRGGRDVIRAPKGCGCL